MLDPTTWPRRQNSFDLGQTSHQLTGEIQRSSSFWQKLSLDLSRTMKKEGLSCEILRFMFIPRSLEEWSSKKERWICVLNKFLTQLSVSWEGQLVKSPLIWLPFKEIYSKPRISSFCIKGGESQMSRRSTPAPQRRKLLTKSLSVGDSLGSEFDLSGHLVSSFTSGI